MGIIGKIRHKATILYNEKFVKAQYPMLTFVSRNQQEKKGAIGLVYMLHHITEKNPHGIPTNEDLKVSPTFLEDIIVKYKKQGFVFISLDQLNKIITSEKKPSHPFIALTIDDGYLDNYTQALPVFESQQVPFTIFIATDFIDKKTIMWWDILEELVQNNDSIYFEGIKFQCQTFQEKWDVYRILREKILNIDQTKFEMQLKESFSDYDIDWLEPIRREAMSWEQVKELSQHPLCTIGGHTVSHLALNQLSDDDFRREISEGITKLRDVIGKPICHFAYPYGSPNEIGEREYNLISEFHFKTVFTSYGGCITKYNKHQITHLPRVYLHERKL